VADLTYNVANTAGQYLALTFVQNGVVYADMTNVTDYVIQSGDYLEYEIWWDGSGNKLGVDFNTTSSNLRDSGAVDQNGYNAHPQTIIPAHNVWYLRYISLASRVGHTINQYTLVCEVNGLGTYTGKVRNIKITAGALGSTNKAIWLSGDAAPTLNKITGGSGSSASAVVAGGDGDGVGLADTVSALLEHQVSVTDSTGAVDRAAVTDWDHSDDIGFTDYKESGNLAVNESVGLTDTVARQYAKSYADSTGLTDRVAPGLRTFTDSGGLTDALDFGQSVVTWTVSDAVANPGTVTVAVAGGEPEEAVEINLVGYGSNPLATGTLDEAGNLARSVVIPSGYTGAQSLEIVLATSGTLAASFDAGSAQAAPSSPGAPTAPTPVTTTRWVLEDVGPGGVTYTFPNNPSRMSSPHPRRSLTTEHSTSPDGQALIWEGAARPYAWEFAGYCGTEAFYDALKLFVDIGRRFYLTDHRSRQWIVSFDHFDAQPRRDINNDWAHDYTMRATIYGGPL
jgi:hypothetical protein